MAIYHYKAMAGNDRNVSGVMTADSPRHAREQLRSQGLVVTQLLAAGAVRQWRQKLWRPSGVGRTQMTQFYRELATLIATGVPLLDSLDACLKQARGGLRRLLMDMREQVGRGVSLADAMAAHPQTIDAISISLIRVGERAGTLEDVLERLATFRSRADRLQNRLVNALIYPALVLCLAVVVTLILMRFVVPNILAPLLESGRDLPWITSIVKACSDALLAYGWLFAILIVAAVATVVWLLRIPHIRFAVDARLLRAPLLGELVRRQAVVRVCLVVATLMQSGVGFLESIEIACGVVKNRAVRKGLENVGESVKRGREIADALEETHVFPPSAVQVFRVGQQSGHLEALLLRLAEDYDQQSDWAAQRLAAAIEPAMILLLAALVGTIVFATVLPIMEAGDVL